MDLITFDSGEAVRKFQEDDRSHLYHVCLATGDSGASALHLYNEKEMLGEIYVGPYLSFQPDLSLTLIKDGVAGYALAALDTRTFDYIQNPPLRPKVIVDQYPSHLHIDLLETAQGRGIGKAMMHLLLETLREKGSKGVHLGMGSQNARAFAFYTKLGFTLLDKNDYEWTMGLKL